MNGRAERSPPATDRTLRNPADLDRITFDDQGLVPVVAQDAGDGAVLMVAWANREALERSLATGHLHFWSRSRDRLWEKGETSGNTLHLRTLHLDCDGDTVLARVDPAGPACHTGERTCFGAPPEAASPGPAAAPNPATEPVPPRDLAPDTASPADVLDELQGVLDRRNAERPEGSYTTRLLEDENLRLKKLGEETAEVIAALARGRGDEATREAADLVYHLLVALTAEGSGLENLRRVLARRKG